VFDPPELARLGHVTPLEWVATWKRLERFWIVADGKISQRRQLDVLETARENRRKARKAGQAGAEGRKRKAAEGRRAKAADAPQDAVAMRSHCPSSLSSPSSSPSSSSGGGAAPSRPPRDLDVALTAFTTAWRDRYRQDYVVTDSDRSQLGRLLRSLAAEQVRALPVCFERYLADASPFVATEKRHSLAWFIRDDGVNKYRTSAPVVSAKEARTAAALGRFLDRGGE
jgi:hypothetical protein